MPTALIMKASSNAEGLARKVRRAVQTNRGFITYGADAFLVDAARHMPRWLHEAIGKGFARIMLLLVRDKQRTTEPARDGAVISSEQSARPFE
jgi:hypothetical protein